MLGILFWLPCGLFCWMMTRTVLRDDLSEIQAEEAVAREALTVKDPDALVEHVLLIAYVT